MDWGRAKTVLVISFLLLNGLLAFQLTSSKQTHSQTNPAEELKSLMLAKNIELKAQVIDDTPKLQEITVHFTHDSREELYWLEPSVPISLMMDKDRLGSRLAREIEHGAEYKFDQVISDESKYIFHQLYQDLPLFDIQLQFFVEDDDIIRYRQSYVQTEESATTAEQRVLSAYTAMASLVEYRLPYGAIIADVQLGYHGQMLDSETQVLAPSWRIVLEGGQIYYIHAIHGALLPH